MGHTISHTNLKIGQVNQHLPSVSRPLAPFGLDSNFKTLKTFNFTYKGGLMIIRY
jgi:hypothetical protein